MRFFIGTLVFNLLILSCMTQPSNYTYADGSGNVYILSPTSLEYDPVKPEESSTGMYSGGEPKTVTISSEQFTSVRTTLESAINNTSVHINDRVKMSGAISVISENETKRYFIKPECIEQEEIERVLKEIILR